MALSLGCFLLQVQGQLEIFDYEWCNLFCWTAKGSAIYHIRRDREFWALIWPALAEFWWYHVVPARMAKDDAARELYRCSQNGHGLGPLAVTVCEGGRLHRCNAACHIMEAWILWCGCAALNGPCPTCLAQAGLNTHIGWGKQVRDLRMGLTWRQSMCRTGKVKAPEPAHIACRPSASHADSQLMLAACKDLVEALPSPQFYP